MDPHSLGSFCPDCGKEIDFSWYILRCKCCLSKKKAHLIYDFAVPTEKFCSKCGTAGYFIEKKQKIDINDIHYAILIKEELSNSVYRKRRTQIWVEAENVWSNLIQPKLIPSLSK